MPVVGSSAYNTTGQITSLVRALLNDAQGNLFTDAVLLPYANSAYRKTQRALSNAGAGGFIQDDVLLVAPRSRRSIRLCKCRSPTPPRRPISSPPICWCQSNFGSAPMAPPTILSKWLTSRSTAACRHVGRD